MNSENRDIALEMANDSQRSDHFDSDAIVQALIYVGDAIERQTVSLVEAVQAGLREQDETSGNGVPKLTALPSRPTPFEAEKAGDDPGPSVEADAEDGEPENGYFLPGGRPYRPATNPEDWRLDASTGEYVSPAGRRYNPRAHHVQGMLQKLKRRGITSVRLYDPEEPRPIKSS